MAKRSDPRVEQLERALHELVAERQRLRADGGDSQALERNRRDIVARQHALAEVLISLYGPHSRAA
jgi:hypothetical protein